MEISSLIPEKIDTRLSSSWKPAITSPVTESSTPLYFFQQLIPESIFQINVAQTNLFAKQFHSTIPPKTGYHPSPRMHPSHQRRRPQAYSMHTDRKHIQCTLALKRLIEPQICVDVKP
jgi:hypothetical protein